MTDNQLGILIRQTMIALLAQQGISDLPVIVAFQPTTQGRDERGLYINAMPSRRYGWQERADVYDEVSGDQIHTEGQWHEQTFQVQGFTPANINDLNELRAKDLTEISAMLIASQPFLQALTAENVGLQRITEVRNPFFVNDEGNFEANPSFDFTVTHKRTIIQTTPSITSTDFQAIRV
jgi:hypothetical protein